MWTDESFQSLLDAVPDALIVTNRPGEIVLANAQAARLFGISREQLMGRPVESLLPPRLRDGYVRDRVKYFDNPTVRPNGTSLELLALRSDGTEIPIDVNLRPLVTESGTFIISSIRDATERRSEEEAKKSEAVQRGILESEERFRLMADFAPVMIWVSGTDKLCTYFNKTWLEFTGRSLDREIGNGWAERVHPDDLHRCLDTYAKAFDLQETFKMEYRIQRFDGEYRWIMDIGAPRFDATHSFAGYIGCGVDITDRILAEEILSSVNRRMIEAQEQERTRIARELHDDFSQQLALLLVELEQVKPELSDSTGEGHRLIEELVNQISEMSDNVKNLARQLHSSKLQYLGLVAAMRDFSKQLARKHTVEIHFTSGGMPETLPAETSLCLFRVMQEALSNAVKYSGEKHFEVEVQGSPAEIILKVRDSGVGFDPELAKRTHGLGLISMKERVNLVNGTLSIATNPQAGTEISVRVPLSAETLKRAVAV